MVSAVLTIITKIRSVQKKYEDGKIFIEPQGFCVMAEIGLEEGCCLKAMESVEKYLDTKYGTYLVTAALPQISCGTW